MPSPDDLLDQHGHLLLMSARCLQVLLGRTKERGGVHELDGFDEPLKPRGRVGLVVRDHLGFVDPGERPVHCVLEHARGPDSERRVHFLDECPQVSEHLRGKRSLLKCVGNAFVREIRLRDVVQLVAFEEGIEDRRRDDDHARDRDGDAELGIEGEVGDHVAGTQETVRLPPERPGADPGAQLRRRKEAAIKRRDRWGHHRVRHHRIPIGPPQGIRSTLAHDTPPPRG